MHVKKDAQEKILEAISEIGASGAAITEIERKVDLERHTLSKYLSFMQGHGLVYHKKFAAAKVWFINKAPLQMIAKSPKENLNFIENLLLNLISHIPIGVIIIDRNYDIQFMNEAMLEKYGELQDKNFYENVLGLGNPLKIKPISTVIEGNAKTSTLQISDRNGNFLGIKAAQIMNPDKSLSIILLIEDITKPRIMEEKLKKLSSAVEQTGDIIFICGRDGRIEYVNRAFEEQTGYRQPEIMGKTPNLLKSGKHAPAFYENMWKTILSGRIYRGTITNRKKNGRLFYERKTIAPIKDSAGRITHFVSIGKDITDLVHFGRRIAQSEKMHRNLFESSPCGCHNLGPDGTFMDVNHAELEMLGYRKSELVGKKNWTELIAPEEIAAFRKHWNNLAQNGKVSNAKYTLSKKDGKKIKVRVSSIANFDRNRRIINTQDCVVRIDERK